MSVYLYVCQYVCVHTVMARSWRLARRNGTVSVCALYAGDDDDVVLCSVCFPSYTYRRGEF